MEEDNIKWENMGWHAQDANMVSSLNEKTYKSLYEELLDKCNPINFMDTALFHAANSIYASLKKLPQEYGIEVEDMPIEPTKEVVSIRNRAIRELEIHIQTNKKVSELLQLFDPQIYIDMEPYDEVRVQQAYDFYQKVQQYSDDILALEEIERLASEFISRRRAEIEEYHQSVNRKKVEEQEIEKQKKIQEQIELEKNNTRVERIIGISFIVMILLCTLAAITSK